MAENTSTKIMKVSLPQKMFFRFCKVVRKQKIWTWLFTYRDNLRDLGDQLFINGPCVKCPKIT